MKSRLFETVKYTVLYHNYRQKSTKTLMFHTLFFIIFSSKFTFCQLMFPPQ